MLPILFIFAFIVFAYPPILIPVFVILIGYLFLSTYFDRKQKEAKKKIYDARWSPSVVFERRMKYAKFFEDGSWERSAEVVVAAKLVFDGAYCGVIKTSTGLELWRCEHGHRSKSNRSLGRRNHFATNPSITMARRCAKKQLTANYTYYVSQGKNQRGGVKHKRPVIENSLYEPVYDTLKSFRFQCAYCGKPNLTKETTHRDHVVPLIVGGANSSINMLPVCSECNLSKGAKSVFQFTSLEVMQPLHPLAGLLRQLHGRRRYQP